MGALGMMIIGVLLIAIIVFVVLGVMANSANVPKQQANVMFPFNSSIPPGGGSIDVVSSLTESGDTSGPKLSQIRCPTGYKVNIIGSFTEVTDPNLTCSPTPVGLFQTTCGSSGDLSNTTCDSDANCPPGMSCLGKVCKPSICSDDSSCGISNCLDQQSQGGFLPGTDVGLIGSTCINPDSDPVEVLPDGSTLGSLLCYGGTWQLAPSQGACTKCVTRSTQQWSDLGMDNQYPDAEAVPGVCVISGACGNLNTTFQNKTCGGSTGTCHPRDSSAYLANFCDGKNQCDVSYIPNSVNVTDADGNQLPNPFGTMPCDFGSFDSNNSSYTNLPIEVGWTGGAPENGADAAAVSYNQGFYVHGIYTCIPDEEYYQPVDLTD